MCIFLVYKILILILLYSYGKSSALPLRTTAILPVSLGTKFRPGDIENSDYFDYANWKINGYGTDSFSWLVFIFNPSRADFVPTVPKVESIFKYVQSSNKQVPTGV